MAISISLRNRHSVCSNRCATCSLILGSPGKSGPLDRPFSAESALGEATANLRTTIEQAGAQTTHAVLPDLYVYPVHLVQLFQNLIANAIKYRSGGAPPRIHVEARRQADRWLFSAQGSVPVTGIGLQFAKKNRSPLPGKNLGSIAAR